MSRKIFTINPGSTSTKIGWFEDAEMLFSVNLRHAVEEIASYTSIQDQLPFRKRAIDAEVSARGVNLAEADAFVGRGGLSYPVEGGTYRVSERLLEDLRIGVSGQHPCNLGAQLANEFAKQYGGSAFIVNPVVVDELEDVARISGLKEIPRTSILHALNQKEVAIQCAEKIGKAYEDCYFVVAHLGGGISISSHYKGRIIDTTNGLNGDGPLAPTRSGDLPAAALIDLCFSGEYTRDDLYTMVTKKGGLTNHLGTDDGQEVGRRIEAGDCYAKLIYDAMIYQIGKYIAAYSAPLKGKVDRVIITGGLAHDRNLIARLQETVGYIAPFEVYPGELELEALAAGALRVLEGRETAKEYVGNNRKFSEYVAF